MSYVVNLTYQEGRKGVAQKVVDCIKALNINSSINNNDEAWRFFQEKRITKNSDQFWKACMGCHYLLLCENKYEKAMKPLLEAYYVDFTSYNEIPPYLTTYFSKHLKYLEKKTLIKIINELSETGKIFNLVDVNRYMKQVLLLVF